jgi:hypothetical protein
MKFDIEPPDTFIQKMAVLLIVAMLGVAVLASKGCAHTADWDKDAFDLKVIEKDGKKLKAWVPKFVCDPFKVRTGDRATFTCCQQGGECYELPIWLNVQPSKVQP